VKVLRRVTHGETFGDDAKLYKSVRVVLFDSENLVAVMRIGKINAFTLPGGGIEEGEMPEQAALREILEETGCESELTHELGIIEENSKTYDWNGSSTCFIAKVKGGKGVQKLTEIEIDEETSVLWLGIHEALELITNQKANARDRREEVILEIMKERNIALLREALRVLATENGR